MRRPRWWAHSIMTRSDSRSLHTPSAMSYPCNPRSTALPTHVPLNHYCRNRDFTTRRAPTPPDASYIPDASGPDTLYDTVRRVVHPRRVGPRRLVRHCTTRRTLPTRRAPTPCTTPRRVVQCISDSTPLNTISTRFLRTHPCVLPCNSPTQTLVPDTQTGCPVQCRVVESFCCASSVR